MIRLESNQLFILDRTAEVFTVHDSVDSVMRQLITRRRTGHLIVQVVKKDRAKLFPVDRDLIEFSKKLKHEFAAVD